MSFFTIDNFKHDCSVGYLVRRAHQLGQGGMEPVFTAEQMTGIQWSALMAIRVGRATSSAELAREISYDKGATTRLVDMLEANGWVTRTRQSDDRRVVTLALTPPGEALCERVRLRVIALWNDWLTEWPSEDVAALITMLQRLRDTLEGVTRDVEA